MENNEIFKGIISKVKQGLDSIGNKVYYLYAKVYSEATGYGVGSEFEVKTLSIVPTQPLGTKSSTIPDVGQIVLLYRSDMDMYTYIIGYIDGVIEKIPNYERSLDIGEFNIYREGVYPVEFYVKPDKISMNIGIYNSITLSGKSDSLLMESKNIKLNFFGGYQEYKLHEIGGSSYTSYYGVWSETKESNSRSDKYYTNLEQEKLSVSGIDTYSNKVVEQRGAIVDYKSNSKLSHVYQLETRQAISNKFKDTFSILRLGYQSEAIGKAPDNSGSIIEWNTKKLASGSSAEVTLWKRGLNKDGEFYRNQLSKGIKIYTSPVDKTGSELGYDKLDESVDNKNKVSDFWFSESVNSGDGGYFYRMGFYKNQSMHHFLEYSDLNYFLVKNYREDINQTYINSLQKNNYIISLETTDTTYNISYSGNKIKINIIQDNEESIVELTKNTVDVKSGDIKVVAKSVSVEADKVLVDSKDTTFKGNAVTVAGTPSPEGQGAFCGIPYCLFTGAPHSSTKSINN